jgi:uncharacterized protein YecE (DUF72 family)
VDRTGALIKWVELFRQLVSRNLRIYAYANNHYAGHGPAMVRLLWELYNRKVALSSSVGMPYSAPQGVVPVGHNIPNIALRV